MHENRFEGDIARLRAPDRLARLEVPHVVDLCMEGIQPTSMLDVGVGTAVFAESFARQGLKVSGIDANPEMIPAAQGFVPEGDFQLAPAEAIPYEDHAFDLVFLGLVLHETDDPEKALQEAKRVGRQRVVVLEWPYEEAPVGPPLEHRMPTEKVLDAIEKANFARVQIDRLTHVILYRLDL